MSLSLVGGNNLVELRGLKPTFRRPHGVGLIPGRVFAGFRSRAHAEAGLRLRAHALTNIVSLNWPRGHWRWMEEPNVLLWLGSRTDAFAPLKLPPPTYVRLASALARLAADDIVLSQGYLLGAGGWSPLMSAEGLAFALMRAHPYQGIAGSFSTARGHSGDEWECEIYTNGMVWADTSARLSLLCRHLAEVARTPTQLPS
jgi:hypothetical protein